MICPLSMTRMRSKLTIVAAVVHQLVTVKETEPAAHTDTMGNGDDGLITQLRFNDLPDFLVRFDIHA